MTDRAFPSVYDTEDKRVVDLGMSLRDWFAGRALGALIQNLSSTHSMSGGDHDSIADEIEDYGWGEIRHGFSKEDQHTNLSLLVSDAYAISDAMLAERQRKQ